jgi:AcrR family transcriptional regulator
VSNDSGTTETRESRRAGSARREARAERNRRTLRRQERISRQQEARRRDILNVARDLLTRSGLSHFHMETVAEEGGYSRTSIYRYFPSKEDLVMDLAIESVELRIGLYRRVQAWDARARERAVAFGEVTAMLYPRHVLPEVYAVNAVREASTPERTRRFAQMEREQTEIVLAVAREAVECGDWQLPPDLNVEEAMFGIGTMTRGLFDRIDTPLPPGENVRDPQRVQRSMGSRLLDSLGWRPLSTEWDYAATMRRIYTELIPPEVRAALGLIEERLPIDAGRAGSLKKG